MDRTDTANHDNSARSMSPKPSESKIFDRSLIIPAEKQAWLYDAATAMGIDMHDDNWNYGHLVKVRKARHYMYRFALPALRIKYRNGFGMIRPFVKGFVVNLLISGPSPEKIGLYLHDLRAFDSFLAREGITCLSEVTLGVLAKYENEVNLSDLAIYTKGMHIRTLQSFFEFVDIRADWRPQIPSDSQKESIDCYRNKKEKRLPDVVMNQISAATGSICREILAEDYNPSWYLERDLFAGGALILAAGTRSRISEVLTMGSDAEFETESGNTGLLLLKEKDPKGPVMEPKTVVKEYIDTVRMVLAALKKVTAVYREYAEYWENRGHVTEILPGQSVSKSLFCYYIIHSHKNGEVKRLPREILDSLLRDESMLRRTFCKAVHITFGYFSQKFGVAQKVPVPLRDLCYNAFGYGFIYTPSMFNHALKKFCRRYQITYKDRPYNVNAQQIRHLTSTTMLNNGATMAFTDAQHGRSTAGQSAAYDHPTDVERIKRAGDVNQSLQKIISSSLPAPIEEETVVINTDRHEFAVEAIEKGHFTGPRALKIRQLRERYEAAKITEGELAESIYQLMGDVTLAPNGAGLCVQNRYERPCGHAHSCFVIATDGEPCNKLMPTVSIENLSVLKFHARETEAAMKKMLENKVHLDAGELPYWEERYNFQQKKMDNIKRIERDVREQLEYRGRGLISSTGQLEGDIVDG